MSLIELFLYALSKFVTGSSAPVKFATEFKNWPRVLVKQSNT